MSRAIVHVEQRILMLRGERVLLDADLAELYGVTTKALNQAATASAFPRTSCFN